MKELAQNLTIPWGSGPSDTRTLKGIPGVQFTTIGEIMTSAIGFIFLFAGVGLLLMLISGGFSFLTSAGDPKKMEKGKATVTNALLGFILVFTSFWAIQAMGYIFGVDTLTTLFK